MRFKSLLVTLFFQACFLTQAQDWSIFYPDQYMFTSEYNVQADSSRGDTLYMSKYINESPALLIFSHFAKHIYLNDSVNTLQTGLNKKWHFKKGVAKDSSWTILSDTNGEISATVSDIREEGILGVTDSIREITLSSISSPYTWVDSKIIKWSKHYGLIQTINFDNPTRTPYSVKSFTNDTLAAANLSDLMDLSSHMEGTNIDSLGTQKLTLRSIYCFEVGDIMQTHYIHRGPDSWFNPTHTEYEIIAKMIYQDSMTYSIIRSVNELDPDDESFVYGFADTIYESIIFDENSNINQLSNVPFFNSKYRYMTYYTREGDKKYDTPPWLSYDENGVIEHVLGGCFSQNYYQKGWYKQLMRDLWCGIGGTEINDTYYSGWLGDYGTRYDFILSTNENYQECLNGFYPNPVENTIQITCGQTSFKISDLKGNNVIEGECTNRSIDVSSLPKGFYILELERGSSVLTERFEKL